MKAEAKRMFAVRGLVPVLALTAILGGCKGADATPAASTTATTTTTTPAAPGGSSTATYVPKASAGVPIQASMDLLALANLTAAVSVSPRTDPFALTSNEKSFDMSQLAERLNQESGSTELMYEVPPEQGNPALSPSEPQPYRRLSGILVGDSVLGILVTPSSGAEGGDILRPGQMVPGTDFKVLSIDEEKMVLYREGSRRPNKVIVRLEQAPPNLGGGGGAFTGGGRPPAGGAPGGAGLPPGVPGGK